MNRNMLYVEYPLARSLFEAIECLENGGSVWQEISDDFPDCAGFDTSEDLADNFPDDEIEEYDLIHLVPKGLESIPARPFVIEETVWATERFFITNDLYMHKGDSYKIVEISDDGKSIKLDVPKNEQKDTMWPADKFCRCVLPVDKKKVYALADMTSSSVGYDLDNVYEDLSFLKEECDGDTVWSDSYQNEDEFIDYMKSLGHSVSGINWDIVGYGRETGELVYAIQQCFLRTR